MPSVIVGIIWKPAARIAARGVAIGILGFPLTYKSLTKASLVLPLNPLKDEDVIELLSKALTSEKGLKNKFTCDEKALEHIARSSGGDARRGLIALETAAGVTDAKKRLEISSIINDTILDLQIHDALDIGTTSDDKNASSNIVIKNIKNIDKIIKNIVYN